MGINLYWHAKGVHSTIKTSIYVMNIEIAWMVEWTGEN